MSEQKKVMNFLRGWHKNKKVVYLKGLYINKYYMGLINRQLFKRENI